MFSPPRPQSILHHLLLYFKTKNGALSWYEYVLVVRRKSQNFEAMCDACPPQLIQPGILQKHEKERLRLPGGVENSAVATHVLDHLDDDMKSAILEVSPCASSNLNRRNSK
jgi:hypothetical protein